MSFQPPERFNIAHYFLDQRVEEGRGERIALRLDDRQITYDEVLALSNHFGQVLLRIGVRPQERVLIALPDGPDFAGSLFGVLKIGAVVVMVNPSLEPEALAGLFDYSRARVAVVDAGVLPRFEEAIEKAAWRPGLLVVGDGEHSHRSFEKERQDVPDALETAPTHRDDPAIWLFSGGTTGRPKAVVQSHTSFANTTECYAKTALGYREDDITLSVPKLFFGYATGSNLFFPFSVGASAVLYPEHPTAEVVFEKIRRHRPTILVNVPTMVNRMVQHPDASSQDLSCLRFATSAGEALPAPLYRSWRQTFGVELLDGLGTAEMWHIFISNLPDEARPGTLGRPVPGFDVEIRDADGQLLPGGEVGRLWVRGNSRAIGYWQNMSQTAEAFQGEWFVGGDLVRQDEDGYITYCGRADDVLKVGGKWLVPQEVESCLMKHPAVDECAVIGVETAGGLTKPWAFVIAKDSSADLEQTLKQFVLDQLQPYKHPRRVVVVDSFPRTHLGKIDRGKLKQTAQKE